MQKNPSALEQLMRGLAMLQGPGTAHAPGYQQDVPPQMMQQPQAGDPMQQLQPQTNWDRIRALLQQFQGPGSAY